MSTNIIKTNGELLTALEDYVTDTNTCSIILVGRNVKPYGTYINSSLVRIMENFCNSSAPNSPLIGQQWYDNSKNRMSYFNNSWINLLDQSDKDIYDSEISQINTHLGTIDGQIVVINQNAQDLKNELENNYLNRNTGGIMNGNIIMNDTSIQNEQGGANINFNTNGDISISDGTTTIWNWGTGTTKNISSTYDIVTTKNMYVSENKIVSTQEWTIDNFVYGSYKQNSTDNDGKSLVYDTTTESIKVCYDNGVDNWVTLADKNWVISNYTPISTQNSSGQNYTATTLNGFKFLAFNVTTGSGEVTFPENHKFSAVMSVQATSAFGGGNTTVVNVNSYTTTSCSIVVTGLNGSDQFNQPAEVNFFIMGLA